MIFIERRMEKTFIIKAMAGRLSKEEVGTIAQGNDGDHSLISRMTGMVILLLFLILSGILDSQAQDTLLVKGVILSGTNEPVPNVSVGIEGSYDIPFLTNEKGEFQVNATSPDDWLILAPSSLYKNKRLQLNHRRFLKIYLTDNDLASLDDEHTILAQKKLRKNIVSSFFDLPMGDISETTAMTVDQYFQGRVPGLFVSNRSGDPASGAVTLLRGVRSLNANNQPLFVVDGVMLPPHSLFESNLDGFSYNPLLGINPFDISQTTIIRDPSITAAYGSKASNGLIIIETLDPSATRTSIEINIRSGYSLTPPNMIPQMNSGQHKTLINEVLFTSGIYGEHMTDKYPNLFLTPEDDRYVDYQHNTDWQKLIFENSFFRNIDVKVMGGDEIARYGLSLDYINSDGIIKTTNYDGFNLRFVSLLNIFTWLKMNATVSLNNYTSNLKESGKVKETSPILTSLGKSPLLGPYQYDLEGKRLTTLTEVDELGVSNPLAIINNFNGTHRNYNFVLSLGLHADLARNLKLNSLFGLTYNVLKEQLYLPNRGMEHYYNNEAINVSKMSNNNLNAFYNNTYLNYDKNFGKNHKLTSTTGINILNNVFEYDWALAKNAHANDEYRTISDGENNLREIGGSNRIWNWISLYEHLSYSYKDKYLISGSLSLDGSSNIGKNASNTLKIGQNPFGLFYGAGMAWRVSSEPFLHGTAWLEELKLRITYGRSGNDDIGESSARKYYRSVKFRETVGLYPAIVSNDELTYEFVNQSNLGIDASILGNRIRTSIDLFRSMTDNLLIYSPLKPYMGYEFRPENGGKIRNQGWEINTFYRIIDNRAFKWDFQASLASSSNEIVSINGEKLVTDVEGAQIVNQIGYAANSFYGYLFDGVYSTEEQAREAGLVNDKLIPFRAGDAIFRDISGPDNSPDGVINDYDKTIIGSSAPDFHGGLMTSLTYKRWTLSAFAQFVYGNELFNYVRYKNERMSSLVNQSTYVLNRWQYEGQETDVPRALWADPIGNSAFSTRWIEYGSYLRIKNLALKYKVPEKFLAFKNVEFYISANNLFVFSKYLGYDPEFGYSYSQVDQGIDYGLTPQARQFVIGLKVGL